MFGGKVKMVVREEKDLEGGRKISSSILAGLAGGLAARLPRGTSVVGGVSALIRGRWLSYRWERCAGRRRRQPPGPPEQN